VSPFLYQSSTLWYRTADLSSSLFFMRFSLRMSVTALGLIALPVSSLAMTATPVTRLELASAIATDLYGTEHDATCFMDIVYNVPAEYGKLFADVQKTDTNADTICMGMRAGYINGHHDGTFRPASPVNVAEASQMIGKAYDLYMPSLQPVKGPWYGQALEAVRAHGVVSRQARPEDMVTATTLTDMLTKAAAVHAAPVTPPVLESAEEPLDFGAPGVRFAWKSERDTASGTTDSKMRDNNAELDLGSRRDAYQSRRSIRAKVLNEFLARQVKATDESIVK
jgi:S-layer homology domain